MAVTDYNTDPDLNTAISGINIAEGCPPSGINNAIRQMMADIKSDCLITSGAQTAAGEKTFSDSIVAAAYPSIKRPTDSTTLTLLGGSTTAISGGAKIQLNGGTYSSNPGAFIVQAGAGIEYKQLIGSPDGTLVWDSKGFVYDSGNQTITDCKVFNNVPVLNYSNGNTSVWLGINQSVNKGDTTTKTDNGHVYFGASSSNVYSRTTSESATSGIRWGVDSEGKYKLGVMIYNNTANNTTFGEHIFGRTAFYPSADNSYTLGTASYRWKQLYAGTATIATSDERKKSNISSVPDAVLDAWGDVQWQQFQFIDAIEEKGENARLHNGLIAQRIDAVFKAHGLDASQYGLFCHDIVKEEPEERDEQGEIIKDARPAGDIFSLRYEEALCMEAAYQRRRADRAEARLANIEARLAALEAK